jgi:hypothetical protein
MPLDWGVEGQNYAALDKILQKVQYFAIIQRVERSPRLHTEANKPNHYH